MPLASLAAPPVRKVSISPSNPELANALVSAFESLGIHATYLDPNSTDIGELTLLTEGMTERDVDDRHWQVLEACKTLHGRATRIVLVGRDTASTYNAMSGLHGLSRTLRQEWPDVSISSLNVHPACRTEDIAQAALLDITEAILTPDGLQQMQLGESTTPTHISMPSQDDVWFISGGARGVTAACTIELARRLGQGTFLLAGRSAVEPWPADLEHHADIKTLRGALALRAKSTGEKLRPSDIDRTAKKLLAGEDIRRTLQALTEAGVTAHYVCVDVSDRASVTVCLADLAQRFGPITGLVHGAGVLADGLALKKTKADLQSVFSPKVFGLLNLLDALDLSALRYCGLFSSASAVFGNIGQSDYAMANAWLNGVARDLQRTHPNLAVKSFCWGPWAGGMVDASLAEQFAEHGIKLIGLQDGADIFAAHMLGGEREQIELLIGDQWDA